MKRLCLLCSLTLIVICKFVSLTGAKVPETAKIALASNRDGNWDIYLMNPDGSEVINLTQHPATDYYPVWSPTGAQLLFVSFRDGPASLYLMDADGANVRRVSDQILTRLRAAWAPDGGGIAYMRLDELYIATIDGKAITHLATIDGKHTGDLAWSPDGTEIAFRVFKDAGAQKGYELRIFDLQTRKEKTIFADVEIYPEKRGPAWAPSGDKLALSSYQMPPRQKIGENIFVINADDIFDWREQETIYVINRDGSELQRIVPEKGSKSTYPAWSPHGDEIIYQQKIQELTQLFKINVTGGDPIQLTDVGNNAVANWFDPGALPVQPNAKLLTTLWGTLKQK